MERRLAEGTKTSYGYSWNRFIAFLRHRTVAEGVEQNVFSDMGELIVSRVSVFTLKVYLGKRLKGFQNGELGPEYTENDHKPVSINAIQNDRAAIVDKFRLLGRRFNVDETEEIKMFFSALTKENAQLRSNGVNGRLSRQGGKDNLPFALYRWLAEQCLFSPNPSLLWAHSFSLWLWNLMARCTNISTLLTSNIFIEGDSIGTKFEVTKTKQGGTDETELMHVYANPHDFVICPVLALGLHWSLFSPGIGSAHNAVLKDRVTVFAAGSDGDRFYHDLRGVLSSPEGKKSLGEFALTEDSIGTHSFRKGSTTFAAGGTTAAPPIIAICNRAGWNIGDVLGRYLKMESASDRYLGRVVAGLNPLSSKFAVLPPHWVPSLTSEDERLISSTIESVFSTFLHSICFYPREGPYAESLTPRPRGAEHRDRILPVLKMLLASIVFHSTSIMSRMPPQSKLHEISLFNRDEGVLAKLRSLVTLDGGVIKPTGIPAHVTLFNQLDIVQTKLDSFEICFREQEKGLSIIPGKTVELVSDKLNEFANQYGHPTPESIARSVESRMDQLTDGLQEKIQSTLVDFLKAHNLEARPQIASECNNANVPSTPASSVTTIIDQKTGYFLFFWGGKMRRAPLGFIFSLGSLRNQWLNWWFGTEYNGQKIPPFRFLESLDLEDSFRKPFSRVVIVMKRVKQQLVQQKWNFDLKPISRENELDAWRSLELWLREIGKSGTKLKDSMSPDDMQISTISRKLHELGKSWTFVPDVSPSVPGPRLQAEPVTQPSALTVPVVAVENASEQEPSAPDTSTHGDVNSSSESTPLISSVGAPYSTESSQPMNVTVGIDNNVVVDTTISTPTRILRRRLSQTVLTTTSPKRRKK